jgi:Protein of unknown function (DUF2917)
MDLAMPKGSMLKVEDARGIVLEVKRGMLWLTQEGDTRDRYIAAGDWLRLDGDGLAIANALKRTVVCIVAAEGADARAPVLTRDAAGRNVVVREPLLARLRRLIFEPQGELA